MNRHETVSNVVILAAALFGAVWVSSPASAQTFQNYHCADGTNFIVGFFDRDSRAYMQVDGGAVTLRRRMALSGARYSGSGVTLNVKGLLVTLKHARRAATVCELM